MSKKETLRWAIQSNLVNSQDLARLTRACSDQGQPWVTFEAVPFSDELPPLDNLQPTLFYGSTQSMLSIHRSGHWKPGVYFDEGRFQTSAWVQAYGKACLNAEAQQTTLRALSRSQAAPDQLFFVRPCDDSKAFAGDVMSFASIQEWCRSLEQAPDCVVHPDLPILAAEPVGISHEWRLFVVSGRVSTGSHYRAHHRLEVSPGYPQAVAEFAEELARLWQPAPLYVLDVGQSGPNFYVIEINCFHSAGFYASDLDRLVRDISALPVDGN